MSQAIWSASENVNLRVFVPDVPNEIRIECSYGDGMVMAKIRIGKQDAVNLALWIISNLGDETIELTGG